ncbi:putative acetyltransferase At3g50280 [Bidens hawaiensis]|uniref:putative acetyltransferase At3g50280 n=1 Tax=Bidens hawaiensis TaxID=980011 RepID=UPI004049DA72
MNSTNVEIISDCFVKPKYQSEESKKPIYLSSWDLVLVSINYIQKGLLFGLPENKEFSITTFVDDLKDSLSATLTHFHPLATRLSTRKHQNPPSLTIFLNPENSPGARFIHSAVNVTVADILTPTDVPLIVQSFFDHHKAVNHDGHEQSLLSIKVTELIDGIFIGCSINHMLVDGTSYWHFFNSWSEMFKSRSFNISRPPILDRWILAGSDPIVKLPFTHEDQFINRPDCPMLRERIFHFSSESLAKLKTKANSKCNTAKISTLQSLSALVWRCVTRARRITADGNTSCSLAVSNRSRISPPIFENYLGNMVQTLKGIATAGELLDHGLGWAALRLHEVVVSHNDKAIEQLMDAWVKSPFVVNPGVHFDRNGVHIGSSPRFDMYGNEFGLGKALAVLSGYANKFDGKVTSYPGREGGGSIDLEVCLLPENMAAFEADEEFMSIVNV